MTLLSWLVVLFIPVSCTLFGPSPDQPAMLAVEDVSCTQTWLKVTLSLSTWPSHRIVTLKRDGVIVMSTGLIGSDTVLTDMNLLPKHSYAYQLKVDRGGAFADSSTPVIVNTMDTTSHTISWGQSILLGGGDGSALYDVCIINDTLIYAVGELRLQDSLGNWDPRAYNLARWNGQTWELKRIQFLDFCGQSSTGSYPARAVFAFGAQDIWVASSSQVVRWNGINQTVATCIPVSVNKLWGPDPNSVYAVGYGGQIARYANGIWQRIESGTTLPINDIWGMTDVKTHQINILAAACDYYNNQGNYVLRILGTTVSRVPDGGLPWRISGVWFASQHANYVVGDGIFTNSFSTNSEPWEIDPVVTPYYTNAVRGEGSNDVFVVGAFGAVVHYGGTTWHNYTGNELPVINGSYHAVAAKNGIVCAVGAEGDQAIALIGFRH